ncbi:unnamed protein product [Phytophthora fragariaefolia]|uniref:Unnamed protein product n=1 Tax=Phytophthora fragariaefolia TaxID=1490495 RepID=A0A9W6XQH5_9STRA|nr:unnamed protein product [Phytophthora fragariaefolia]
MPPPYPHRRVQLQTQSRSFQPDNLDPESAIHALPYSEVSLVQAIQTLDETWKSLNDPARIKPLEGKSVTPSTIKVSNTFREALCTLLEIVACFSKPAVVNKSTLVTDCTARVLGCLKRFVAGYLCAKHSIGECCERKCELRLLRVTLLSLLFYMCREPAIACNVVKENLHIFLIKMCAGDEPLGCEGVTLDYQNQDLIDPHDIMITVDPFDWCYRPLCTRLLKENRPEFFIPIGIRPLICLLRGNAIPTDEVSEFELCTHPSKFINKKSTRHRQLPSIFTFLPRDAGERMHVSSKNHHIKLAPLCNNDRYSHFEQREARALWIAVLYEGSIMHLAVRSLIALAINVPRSSAEFKVLLRDGDDIRRVFHAHPPHSSLRLETSLDDDILVDLLPIERIAIEVQTLMRLAHCASSLFNGEHKVESRVGIPQSTSIRNVLRPIKNKGTLVIEAKSKKNGKMLSVLSRLETATEAAEFEFARWEVKYKQQDIDIRQHQRRLVIRKMCADVENLRNHLIESLEVLCTGRQHPDLQQTFTEWIKSLPTLEKLERERQYQHEIRQRQILEQQYLREVIRRREREESQSMHTNDFNVPKESEISMQHGKYQQVLRMQAEIRQLEQRELNDATQTGPVNSQELSGKEKLMVQERLRLIQLENQRREGRELEKMRREDLYYVEHILQAKAKAKEEQEKREQSGKMEKNSIEVHQRYITQMRVKDEEKRVAKRESILMRGEDLVGRQMRFREVEKAKEETQNESYERKAMRAEEHDCRSRWILWDRMLEKQQQEQLKQQRAQARRQKREHQRQEKEIGAAWVQSWDVNGNRYFYNSVTGVSQWELPLA